MKNTHKLAGVISALSLTSALLSYDSFAQIPDPWAYFPNNGVANQSDETLHLALTAPQGTAVSMSYTPATYILKTLPGKTYIDLQIEDAQLITGDDTIKTPGTNMDVIFDPKGSQDSWRITCYNSLENLEIPLLQDGPSTNRLHISDNQCNFNDLWSDTLRIYPGKGNNSIIIKTVWDKDADGNGDEKGIDGINGLGLINVFKFRTKNGTVNLLNTDTTKIRNRENIQIGNAFRTVDKKMEYENSLNWAVIYNTGELARFEFLVDVAGKNELVLFEKDADAFTLYPDSIPQDDGVKLQVQWMDGSYVEPWTQLDQTIRDHPAPKPGEKNSYAGPSGDTISDAQGINSIKWYSINVSQQKSPQVKVIWEGFSVANNGIALAADAVLKPSCVPGENCPEDLLEEIPEECSQSDPDCEEVPLECEPMDLVCLQEQEEQKDPTIPKCRQAGALRACISSTPFPDPHPDSFLDKGDSITYHITLENISPPEQPIHLQNVNLGFENPNYTTLDPSHASEIIPQNGTGMYTGKGPGRFELDANLAPNEKISKDLRVTIDTTTTLEDYDITTADKFTAAAANNASVTLKTLLHHVGKGAVNIQISRCYAFDYFGGEFRCNTTCSTIEPGTKVTVRDTLTNEGGSPAQDVRYMPPPLSSSFFYESHSIRIDDPISGLTVSNDGDTFPPANGITLPGPIESEASREVFFTYYIPDDILETDPPDETEQRDGKCYPKEDDLFTVEEGFSDITYETDCSTQHGEEIEARNGLICVKVEENPKLTVELEAIPSDETTVYQGSIMTYLLRVTNTTNQPVQHLIINGVVPSQTTCHSGHCQGVNVIAPSGLQGKGSYEYTFSVRVNDDAVGSTITHPGHPVTFSGENGEIFEVTSEPIIHSLRAAPEPSGDFQHDITLNRRIVLNSRDGNPRADEGDRSEISHQFSFTGTKKSPVWPQLSGYRNYPVNVCPGGFSPSYEYYDASWNSYTLNYNSTNRTAHLSTLESIGRSPITFQITTTLPDDRPELLEVDSGSHFHQFTYVMPSSAVNRYMKDGGVIAAPELEKTIIRAVKDGVAGEIETENYSITPTVEKSVPEDRWTYMHVGNRVDRDRCVVCGRLTCSYFSPTVPIYRWVMTSLRNVPQINRDKDYITALTSVAWLQTKNGHMGFGQSFWTIDPRNGDPNWVQLSDKTISSQMKFYTPPDEYNADFIVYSPDSADPLRSRMGQKIPSNEFDQGFLGPTPGTLSRGEVYDRRDYPREYMDDLLVRQVYGKVVRLNQEKSLPAGMLINGGILHLNGPTRFEPDTIYSFKGDVQIGTSSPFIISGGRARLVVEGNATIRSNIRYAQKSGTDTSSIPSLRLHATGNIVVSAQVTDIELMMLAEKEFHSGHSDQQLRILGDVIAFQTFWERTPLQENHETEEMVNKPSEIVIEDYRKYILTPPGDKKIPDPGHFWKQIR